MCRPLPINRNRRIATVPLWSRALAVKSHSLDVIQEGGGVRVTIRNDKQGRGESFYMKADGVRTLVAFLTEAATRESI